jgi:hypothetical protein
VRWTSTATASTRVSLLRLTSLPPSSSVVLRYFVSPAQPTVLSFYTRSLIRPHSFTRTSTGNRNIATLSGSKAVRMLNARATTTSHLRSAA